MYTVTYIVFDLYLFHAICKFMHVVAITLHKLTNFEMGIEV